MDREVHRGFQYHASIPYATETTQEALSELNRIVSRLQRLYDSGQFQHYEFGTDYAYDAGVATRDLMAWQKRKLDIPLETRLILTKIYSDSCFDAVEPTLMVRYGLACISLWKANSAKLELRKLRNVIDWSRLVRVVRNVVVLPSVKSMRLGNGRNGSGLGGSSGENGAASFYSSLSTSSRCNSQLGVALSMACLFRCTAVIDDATMGTLNDEILSFLGPYSNDPSPQIVVEAFVSLIPYNDPKAASLFIPLLFDIWTKVTPNVASLCIIPAIAEFAEQSTLDDTDFRLENQHLSLCFQAVLHSLHIPLISSQKSKSSGTMKSHSSFDGSSASGRRTGMLHRSRDTVNVKPFGTHSSAFAKLVVWTLSPSDTRSLDLLDSLVNAVLSFCHPSNVGPWTALIFTSLMEIAKMYIQRFNQEEELNIARDRRLNSEITDRIVSIIKNPVFMGIHSQMPYVFATSLDTLRNIALLSPEIVIPPLLGEVYPTLQHGLHQPHRLITSLACLSRIAMLMVDKPQYKVHLTTLLELTLTNIDANEPKRCLLTLSLFQTVASVTLFKDESDDVTIALASECLPQCVHSLEEKHTHPELMANDDELASKIFKGTTAAYPEILSLYMRRIFELLETTSEHRLGAAASASVLRVLLACSSEIFERLLQMTLEEIVNAQQLSHDAFAQVCGSFVRANCKASFGPMWRLLSTNIREEIIENQAGSGRTIMPKDNALLRYLSILNMSLLAANSESLVEIADDLCDLLRLLREKTNVCVVYTVANTLHHAIAGLVGYSVVLPNPLGESPVSADSGLSIRNVPYLNLQWNVPTENSQKLAVKLFKEHIELSENVIARSIVGASTNVNDEDAVTNALIFTRTATGAISAIEDLLDKVGDYRKRIAHIIRDVYRQLSKDDISGLKEVLFVAKVWLCDVGYERTARLDSHQDTLYRYEKRSFKVPGAHKRQMPAAVLARRAQLYHHQRLALQTQYRDLDDDSRKLILDVIVDACFSAYPAVRRNAFSALYSPLKIFGDQSLYREAYSLVLDNISEMLDKKEFERAGGGFALLKYRSFGIQTVGQFPELLVKFVQTVTMAALADHRQLSNGATLTFAALVPDTFRIGIKLPKNWDASAIEDLYESLTSEAFSDLHWREALFRATALLAMSQCPSFPLKSRLLKLFLEGSLIHHPDLRITCVLGALNVMQKAFRFGLIGYGFQEYKTDGNVDVPLGSTQSFDETAYENDWSLFFMPAPLSIMQASKTQPRPGPKLLKVGSQGWQYPPQKKGIWRAPTYQPNSLSLLNAEDAEELRSCMEANNTSSFWRQLFTLHKVEPRAEDDKMLKSITALFRDLVAFSSFGYCGAGESLESLLQMDELDEPLDLTDKNWHRVTAEAVCGLMLAIPVLTDFSYELVMDKTVHILNLALSSISPETLSYWSSAIAFAFLNVDHRRMSPVLQLLEQSANPEGSGHIGGIKLSLRMELYMEAIASTQWHRPCLASTVKNWSKWDHGLQTTRESSGDEISIAATTERTLTDKDINSLCLLFDLDVPKIELSLLHLLLRLLQLLGGDACLDLLISRGFPFLLKCSAIRDDPEVVVLVTNVFAELAVCTFSQNSLERVSETVIDSIRSSYWHQRIRMLLFLQAFFFNHLLSLSSKTRRTLTMVTIDILADSQAEVRELAADTLSGIVRCSPSVEQKEYVSHLSKRFEGAVGKNTSLVERHAAVLGLGALISAFPYTSPPPHWVPELLALLAVKAAGDSGIVGKSAKDILGDFKKTRQDTWHIDQKVFSQDQLDDLDGVLWRNYFA